jgi:hypothetical protein
MSARNVGGFHGRLYRLFHNLELAFKAPAPPTLCPENLDLH